MAVLPILRPSLTGTPVAWVSLSPAGDAFPNTGQEWVLVVNSGTTARTLTFAAPGACSFGVAGHAHDVPVVVPPDNTPLLIGPFATTRFNDGNNRVQLTVDDVSDLRLAVTV